MKIKVKLFDEWCRFEPSGKGEWIDLRARYTRRYRAPEVNLFVNNHDNSPLVLESDLVPLGVAMRIPKGFEAIVTLGNNSFLAYGFIQTNGVWVIDSNLSASGEEWKLPILVLGESEILAGSRICQFRIQPSQKASVWQRLRWLLTGKVKFEFVSEFPCPGDSRGKRKSSNKINFGNSGFTGSWPCAGKTRHWSYRR